MAFRNADVTAEQMLAQMQTIAVAHDAKFDVHASAVVGDAAFVALDSTRPFN